MKSLLRAALLAIAAFRPAIRKRVLGVGAITLVVAGLAGAVSVDGAHATHAAYTVTPKPGACYGSTIEVHAPYSVSAWAGDEQIAWRAQVWRYSTSGWVRDGNPTRWHFVKVAGGEVYEPYHDGESWTVYKAGYYAVTLDVYSYGLSQYFYDVSLIPLRYEIGFGQEWENDWCGFGV